MLCSLGALPTVVFDATLRADAARLCTALPIALVLSLVLLLPTRAVAALLNALHARRLAWPLLIAAAVVCLGGYLSNVLLIDLPLDPATCAGYALSLGLGALAGGVARTRTQTLGPPALAVALLAFTATFAAIDRFAFPLQYGSLHLALRILGATCATTAAWLVYDIVPPSVGRASEALTAVLLITLPLLPAATIHRSLFARKTVGGHLAERLLQTPLPHLAHALGIHQCQFGTETGWLDAQFECPAARPLPWAVPAPASAERAPSEAPRVLVLVTVDAFRCGLGARDREPFRTACPQLTARAARMGALGSIQVAYPSTLPSIRDMHCGARDACLATELGALGFHTIAVTTHQRLAIDAVHDSFAQWDDSLVAAATTRNAVTSPQTTARALAHVRERDTPRFVWVHYFDPHDPYVPARPSHLSLSAEAAYVDELHRTDAALGALLDGIEAMGVPAAVVVTGDHGESFDEHGTTHHGYELYEHTIRVPLVALGFHGVALPRALPRQSADLAPFLRAIVQREEPTLAPPRPTRTDALWGFGDGTHKVILNHENGRVELYDLTVDPDERDDVARERPEVVDVLLAGMAAAL